MSNHNFPIYNPDKPYHLIKFGSKENMEDLFENGTIYCKSLSYFKVLEDGNVRGDKDEGVVFLKNYSNTRLEISIKDKPIGAFENAKLQWKNYSNDERNFNLYCMYSTLNPNVFQLGFDKKVLEFGDHCVILKNSQEFHDRIRMKLKELQLNVFYGHVCYYDPKTYNGNLSIFNKNNIYDWQFEYRFLIVNPVPEVLKFSIGSLKDIAGIAELNKK